MTDPPQVPRRPLGSTGLTVPVIGLGTVKIGRNTGVKYPTAFDLPGDDEVRALLAAARDLGVNYLDTAPAYGSSEERLGQLLPEPRADWIIGTKVGEEFDPATAQSSYIYTADHTRRSLERSLHRLQRERLDQVLIHSDGDDLRILRETGAFPELIRAKDEGLIRAIGMSVKTAQGALAAIDAGADLLMIELSPWNPALLHTVRQVHQLGAGVIIKKALGSGHFGPPSAPPTPTTSPAAKTVSSSSPKDAVRHAIHFLLHDHSENAPGENVVSSIIIGTRSPQHLREAVEGSKGKE